MSRKYVCKECGSIGKSKLITPGNIVIEIMLWLSCAVPGIFYSIWRINKRYKACKSCSSPEIINTQTSEGKKLVQKHK